MSSSAGRGSGFYNQRLTVVRLLQGFPDLWQGGSGLVDFAEAGPHGPEGFPFNAEYIRRFFQGHVEKHTIRNRPLEDAEAESYALILSAIQALHKMFPDLMAAVENVFFRVTAGHADYQLLKQTNTRYQQEVAAFKDAMVQLSKNGDKVDRDDYEIAAKKASFVRRFARCEWGINVITVDLLDEELFAPNIRRKAIKNAEAADEANRRIYHRHEDLRNEGKTAKDALDILSDEEGLSQERLRTIVRMQRELAGEPPRKQGRPKKSSK